MFEMRSISRASATQTSGTPRSAVTTRLVRPAVWCPFHCTPLLQQKGQLALSLSCAAHRPLAPRALAAHVLNPTGITHKEELSHTFYAHGISLPLGITPNQKSICCFSPNGRILWFPSPITPASNPSPVKGCLSAAGSGLIS